MPARMCLLCSAPTLPFAPAAGRSGRGHDHGEAVHFARVLAEEFVIGSSPAFLLVSCGRRARKRRTSAPGHDFASGSTTALLGVLLGKQFLSSLDGEFGYLKGKYRGCCPLRRAGLRRAEEHADADLRSAQVRDPAGGTRAAALRATVKVPSP